MSLFDIPTWDNSTGLESVCNDLIKETLKVGKKKKTKNVSQSNKSKKSKIIKDRININKVTKDVTQFKRNKNLIKLKAKLGNKTDNGEDKIKNKGLINMEKKRNKNDSTTWLQKQSIKNKKLLQQESKETTKEAKILAKMEKRKLKKRKRKQELKALSDQKMVSAKSDDLQSSTASESTMSQSIKSTNSKQKSNLKKMQKFLSASHLKKPDELSIPCLPKKTLTLREKMKEKLKAARFRYLNEQIYSSNSKTVQNIFKTDPDAFQAYHEGYRQQVKRWTINPLDNIIKRIKKMPKTHVIADFGCGDARLADSVPHTVHSFDLVAANDRVTACDMAKVPLGDNSVDVAVFCLSLMGTNLHDYLLEANRVLKVGGHLKIAEVESRFDNLDNFIEGVERFHFKNTSKDLSNNLFYFLDFKKESDIKNKKKLPTISLLPCLYKKR